MIHEPMVVRAYNGQPAVVNPGDRWPLPYRGSAFSIRHIGRHLRVVWQWEDLNVASDQFPSDLVLAVRQIKGGEGSFRISAHGAVITKGSPDGGRSWEPIYVDKYENDLSFPGIEMAPEGLRRGMYWTGFPFASGERWTVSSHPRANDHLQWRYQGIRFQSTEQYPELYRAYRDLRPNGGRLYITDSGHIWMNLQDDTVPYRHRAALSKIQSEQVDALLAEDRVEVLKLIRARIEAYRRRPVYLGHICEFDHGEAPWTFFGSQRDYRFGQASGNASDDSGRSAKGVVVA